jgi:acyl carrier protein
VTRGAEGPTGLAMGTAPASVEVAELEERVARLIPERLHLDRPDPATDLFESGLLDSLGFVDFLLHLEHEFGIRIASEDVDFERFRNVRHIAEYLAERGVGRGPER